MSSVAPPVPDGFEALAREALAEVTPPDSVGPLLAAEQPVEAVTDLAFASTLPGYAGWHWTVSMAQLPDAPPSVLEVELLPGEGALLAPPWVPWAERLAEYRRTHPEDADVVEAGEELDEDDLEDLDEDELDPDEDVLDDAADDELDGIDFEATADLGEDDAALDDEGDDDLVYEDEDEDDDAEAGEDEGGLSGGRPGREEDGPES